MRKGDKIICINNDNNIFQLTKGKTYTVILESKLYYKIMNDLNFYQEFYQHRFITIKDQRKLKLKKIYENENESNLY